VKGVSGAVGLRGSSGRAQVTVSDRGGFCGTITCGSTALDEGTACYTAKECTGVVCLEIRVAGFGSWV